MTPEEVARKYEKAHDGFRFVGYAEVGLPVTDVALDVYTIEYKQLSPLFEFTLKSIKAGLETVGELSAFLGFQPNFLEGVLAELLRSGDVSLRSSSEAEEDLLSVTEKGSRVLEEAEQSVMIEQSLHVHFDRVMRRPIHIPNEPLYIPRDLRENGWLEVPSLPAKRVEVEDLDVGEIQTVLDRLGRSLNKGRRILLSIKNIVKRFNKFRYAVALRYQAADGSDRLSFAFDGILNDEYERAFAANDGLKKLRLENFSAEPLSSELKAELEPLLSDLSVGNKIPPMQESEREAARIVSEVKERLRRTVDETERLEAENDFRIAIENYEEKRRTLDKVGIRFLNVFDHPPILDEALLSSTERLVIISPWIRRKVVSDDFLNRLEVLLKRNVQVYIGWGIGDERYDPGAVKRLQALSDRYSNFKFKEFGDTHAKVLISDSKFVALGSFNWLSFKGDPTATFRDEQGVLITIPGEIDKKFQEQVKRFE